MKNLKIFKIFLFVFVVSILFSTHFVGTGGKINVGFDSASAQSSDRFELKYGTLKSSIDDYVMLLITKDHRLADEVIFVGEDTTVRLDFVQIQIVDTARSRNDSSDLSFTIRQFDNLVLNESTGKIESFAGLDIWNETVSVDGDGWANFNLQPTDTEQHVWISYKDVTFKFKTQTLEENLLAPVMTNGELFARMMGFGIISALAFGFGGAIGILLEWRAKEIQIPKKLENYAFLGSIMLAMFMQFIIMTFDLNFTREMFFGALVVIGFIGGIMTYQYNFRRWFIITRNIDDEGHLEWNIKKIRIYHDGDQEFILLDGWWQSLGRILNWDVPIVTNLSNFDRSKQASKVIFAHQEGTGIEKISMTEREYRINVRSSHERKVEDYRNDTLKIDGLEEEMRDLHLELKKERAKVRSEAYRHRALGEEMEYRILGLNFFDAGAISDDTIELMAKSRLKAQGISNPSRTKIKEEMEKIKEEIGKDAQEVRNGDLTKRGLASKIKGFVGKNGKGDDK